MNEIEFEKKVRNICENIANMLIEKNKSYGNSALEPINCFYKGDAGTSIKVRIDDKLSRIMRGNEFQGDDTVKDLLVYLVLLKIALEQDNKQKIKEAEDNELPF